MEYFDVVDENGEPTGRIVERSVAHRDGIMHRTAHIWVVRRTGQGPEILLQRRSSDKDSFPNCLDTSSAGHIHAGDDVTESALRELEEELGISAQPEDLIPIGAFRISFAEPFHGSLFRDEEVSFVHVYDKPVDISALQLQPEEVSAVEWRNFADTVRAVKNRDPEICVPLGGLELLGSFLGIDTAAL